MWRVQAYNGTNYGLWSGWAPFTVDTTPPVAPSVSSNASVSPTVTFYWSDTSSDVVSFGYELDGDSNPTWTGLSAGAQLSTGYGYHTLSVFAQDAAGSETETTYPFTIGVSGAVINPIDQTRTQQFVNLSSSTPPNQYPLYMNFTWVTYEYRLGTTGVLQPIPVPISGTSPVTLQGTQTPVNSWPVAVSTLMTWNMASTITTDGPVQVEACFTTAQTGGYGPVCSPPNNVQLTTHTFSESGATAQVGPGTVALLTGDYAVSSTDVNVPTYQGSLSIGRTFTTLAPTQAPLSAATGVFGPGWQASLYGPDAGHAAATLVDNSANGYVTLIDADRTSEIYNASGASTYTGMADTAADGSTITKNSATQYTLTEADGTQTVYTAVTTVTGAVVWETSQVVQDSGTSAAATTSYSFDSSQRVSQIVGPPSRISCAAPLTTAGCRTLTFNYATTTTAVTGTPGDFAGQLKSVSFTYI